MDITEFAREVFSQDRYATEATGIVIEHVGEHMAACMVVAGEHHCNARGSVMGGALFTLADFTAAIAANSETLGNEKPESLHWVSLDSSIHYLSPAPKGAHLRATSKPLKVGRTTALYQTTIENLDKSNQPVAIVETTMVRI